MPARPRTLGGRHGMKCAAWRTSSSRLSIHSGHGPQLLITLSKSATFTTPSPLGCGEMSAGQPAGGAGQAPQLLITASRSATLTELLPSMSHGHTGGAMVEKPGSGAENAAPLPSHVTAIFSDVSSS